MAKFTEQDYRNAIATLVSQGKPLTHANVREVLGGGSYTTIGKYLDEYKTQNALTVTEQEMPEGVETLFANVWGLACKTANESFERERFMLIDKNKGLEQTVEELQEELDGLSDKLEASQAEYEALKAKHEELVGVTGELECLRRDLEKALAQNDALMQALKLLQPKEQHKPKQKA